MRMKMSMSQVCVHVCVMRDAIQALPQCCKFASPGIEPLRVLEQQAQLLAKWR